MFALIMASMALSMIGIIIGLAALSNCNKIMNETNQKLKDERALHNIGL